MTHDESATEQSREDRRLVLVAGAGRSGTSLMTGILGKLGMSVPQPEVAPDETNPRGFSEPKWVVDFHTRVMRTRRLTTLDGRTNAMEMAAMAAADSKVTGTLQSWLEVQFVGTRQVVVKDPRIVWFLPLWQECAQQLGISTGIVTMLRHPTEVISSARTWYGDWQTDTSRACGWINVMLETELATRGLPRTYVAYPELLTAWRPQVARVAAALDIPSFVSVDEAAAAAVDGFVDPSLRRQALGWEGMDVPDHIEDLAERAWTALLDLTRSGSERDDEALDALRAEYVTTYTESERIVQSTIRAEGAMRAAKRSASATPPSRTAGAGKGKSATAQGGSRGGPQRTSRGRAASIARRLSSNSLARPIVARLRNQPAARSAYRRLQRLLGS